MKTILVLTDFTDNAKHAAKFAMKLAENLKANVLLHNSIDLIPTTPYYAGGPVMTENAMWWDEDSKEQLAKLAECLETGADKGAEGQFTPKITYGNGNGTLGSDIADIIKHSDVEIVVMGARTGSALEHVLVGSDTSAVIKHSTRPVMVVPPEFDIDNLKKVVFATEFDDADIMALNYLKVLQQIFHFEIEVVHVSLHEDDKKDFTREVIFGSLVNSLNNEDISFKTISGKDVISRLNRYCHESKANVLAMVHYKNSFLSRVIKASTTKDALAHQKVPLLIIPAIMS